MPASETSPRFLRLFAILGIFSLASSVFLGKSWETSLQSLDSTTHALIGLDTAKGGLLPRLPMHDEVTSLGPASRFNDHPFTLFYLNGKLMRALGPDAWSARLLPGLFSVGCVLLTLALGTTLFSFPVGLLSGLILLLSRDFVLIGSRFHLDTPMIFFILLSFLLWIRKNPAGAGIAAGVGIWMKSPVALLLFPSILFTEVVLRNSLLKVLRPWALSALIALGTGSLIWIATGAIGGWDLVSDYFHRQVYGTAVGGRGGGSGDPWLGLYLLRRNYQPWFWLLLASLGAMAFRNRWKNRAFLIPFSAALVLEGVLALVRFKHWWYFLPVYPFLAILCAAPLESFLRRISRGLETGIAALGVLVPLLLLLIPISLGPEDLPGLRKFAPIVQSHGPCSDRVLFIDGEQPFGGDLNSAYTLAFYSGRKILRTRCEEAPDRILRDPPEWIVVTGKNRENCLPLRVGELYPVEWLFGGQHLLAKNVKPGLQGDLTPLVRELKPPRDCRPHPLPSDPYFPKPAR